MSIEPSNETEIERLRFGNSTVDRIERGIKVGFVVWPMGSMGV